MATSIGHSVEPTAVRGRREAQRQTLGKLNAVHTCHEVESDERTLL